MARHTNRNGNWRTSRHTSFDCGDIPSYETHLKTAKMSGIRKGALNGILMGAIWFFLFCTYSLVHWGMFTRLLWSKFISQGFWYGGKLVRDDGFSVGGILIVRQSSSLDFNTLSFRSSSPSSQLCSVWVKQLHTFSHWLKPAVQLSPCGKSSMQYVDRVHCFVTDWIDLAVAHFRRKFWWDQERELCWWCAVLQRRIRLSIASRCSCPQWTLFHCSIGRNNSISGYIRLRKGVSPNLNDG